MRRNRLETGSGLRRRWHSGWMFLITAFWAGCERGVIEEEPRTDDLPGVHVLELETESIELRREWIGVLEPLKSVGVAAPEKGLISELAVTDGDRVQREDILVRMSSPELSARLEVLQEREASRSNELVRWKRLAEAEAAGPSEVEEARNRLLEVREAVTEIEARLQALTLRSPVSGIVAEMSAAPGGRVSDGEILLKLDDENTLGVRLHVPARERHYLDDPGKLSLVDERGNEKTIRRAVAVQDETAARGFVAIDLWIEPSDAAWPSEAVLSYVRSREGTGRSLDRRGSG